MGTRYLRLCSTRSASGRSADFCSSPSAGTFARRSRCAACCARRRTRRATPGFHRSPSPSTRRVARSSGSVIARCSQAPWPLGRPATRATRSVPRAPSTISRAILTDLLRSDLGFGGLCVTDSLDMSGIADISVQDVVVTGVEAGVDAMMVTSGLDRQLAAAGWIERGVRPERIAQALSRATSFRAKFGGRDAEGDVDDGPARALAAEIAAASITHVGPPLPRLDGPVRVAYFAPKLASPVEELAHPANVFERELRARFGGQLRFASGGSVPDGDGSLVVCSTNAWSQPEQSARVRALLAQGGVLCAMRSPYDAALVPDRPVLLSYGDVPVSLAALAAVLAGERTATGTARGRAWAKVRPCGPDRWRSPRRPIPLRASAPRWGSSRTS